jgi:cytochrome o ubiquinol oxidase subunit 2
MPVNTPVSFQITSDTVMNSFWVPQLSGQIYAMPGMDTQLHLMASRTGSFYGSPANIAGSGFARMNFTAKSVSSSDFNQWVHSAQNSSKHMDTSTYNILSQPSDNNPVVQYSQVPDGLFTSIVSKYMSQEPAGMEM